MERAPVTPWWGLRAKFSGIAMEERDSILYQVLTLSKQSVRFSIYSYLRQLKYSTLGLWIINHDIYTMEYYALMTTNE